MVGSCKQGVGEELRELELCASSATGLLVTMDKCTSSPSNSVFVFISPFSVSSF